MHMIAYISDIADKNADIADMLDRIAATAQRENPKKSITGVLFFVDGKFLQIIEGEEGSLRKLLERIKDDPRHANVEYLIDTEVESRGFSNWSMETFHLNSGKKFDSRTLHLLTKYFRQTLTPRSNTLAHYYKTLLAQPVAG